MAKVSTNIFVCFLLFLPTGHQDRLFESGVQSVLNRLKTEKSKVYVITKPFATLQTLDFLQRREN